MDGDDGIRTALERNVRPVSLKAGIGKGTARFDAPTRAEAETEYLASLAPYRRGDAYEVPGEFVVARGTRAAH